MSDARGRRTLLIGTMLGYAAAIATAGAVTIAVVDGTRLVQAHPDAVDAHAFLQKQASEYESEQKAILERMEQLRDEFLAARESAQNKILSEAARQREHKTAEEKLETLRTAEQKARETLQQRQRELQDHQNRLQDAVAEKIRAEVRAVAEAKGVDLVLDITAKDARGHDVVFFHADRLDITADVLKRFPPKTP